MQYVRRFAINQASTWHVTDYLGITIPEGTVMLCGYQTKRGAHQSRPIEYGVTIGSITVCGRCMRQLLDGYQVAPER